jgi:integrase
MKLTAANVRTLTVPTDINEKTGRPATETVFFDDDVKGFGLRVKASGARSYVMCWKVKALGGKNEHRRVTLGTTTDIDFGKAKEKAKTIKARVRLGDDPATEIQTAKLDAAQTFEATVRQFLDTQQSRYRVRSFKQVVRHLTKDASDLNKKQVAKITKQDIAPVIEKVTVNNGAAAGNHVRSSISAFYSWAMEKALVDANPVIGTTKNKLQSRDRVLTPAEMRLIWNALADDDYGSIMKLLALTGQRESEIGSLSWSEIYDAEIILPEPRTKNGRPHVVPLAPLAVQIIESRERRSDCDFIFGQGKAGFSNWSKAKQRLDKRITEINGGKALTHWTLHDLRRTFATYAGGGLPEHEFKKLTARDKELARGLDILPHVVEAILNHVSGHKAGVAGTYNRSTYAKEKRVALDQWATHLELIVTSDADNVTSLRRKA